MQLSYSELRADNPKRDFGTPIYDEYKYDYWGGMLERIDVYPINLRPNRERDMVYEIRDSPYISRLKTSCQGEGFFGFVEVDDYSFAGAYMKDEVLALEDSSQNHDTPFKDYPRGSMHGSLENQLDHGPQGLTFKQFSQNIWMGDPYGKCSNIDDHTLDFVEIFLDSKDHQRAEKYHREDASLCILGQKTKLPGSIEEHNDAFFMALVRNQSLIFRVPHIKSEATSTNEQKGISQSHLVRRLRTMLEEW